MYGMRFIIGCDGFRFDVYRLPQSPEASAAKLTFVGHVRSDDGLAAIGERQYAVICRRAGVAHLDCECAREEQSSQRQCERKPSPATNQVSAGPKEGHGCDDPPQRRAPRIIAYCNSASVGQRRP